MSIEAMKQALEKIASVNATDYEYQRWAREVLAIAEAEKQELKREWQGLTDEEVERLKMDGRDLEFVSMTALRRFARAIEAKLKEKNT